MRLTAVAIVILGPGIGVPSRSLAAAPNLPALNVEVLLQAPADAKLDWNALKGKVVVVEFWHTRCGPCIYGFPALNRLHESLGNEPVVFLYITDEAEGTVRRFLKDHPMAGWIGIDADRSMFSALKVNALPSTFVVSKTGQFLGWTNTLALTKDGIIQKLLADEEVVLSPEPSTKHDVAWLNGTAEQELPLTLISIAPHQPNLPFPAGGEASDDCMVGYTLPRLIGRFSDVQPAQVVFEGMQPDDRKFDMRLRWPRPDPARHKQTAQAVLETTFGIKIKTGSRQLEVLTLTVRTDAHQEWEPQPVGIFYDAETGLSAADKEVLERMKKGERFFVALGGTTALAHNLSSAMGRPVIDEAHIDGSYSFWFPWDYETNSAEEAKRQVEEKYGVILTPAEREIDVLVVRPAGMGTPHSP